DFLTELIDIYMVDAPKLFDKIRVGIETNDAALFRQGVHSLKGTSGNLGARDFSTLCGQVETLIVNNQIQEAVAMKPSLEEEFERVKSALKALRIEM
ncbi:MAG: Hpt domain-containing protein, partial [Anaerolineaceae bacterium]|nr:Hpt domain-containing protein [Anaerolineaceae bacterium]